MDKNLYSEYHILYVTAVLQQPFLFLLHRCSNFNQITVRIIKANHFLSPTVFHQPVHIGNFWIELLQFVDKILNVLFLKIQLAGIVLRDNLFSDKIFPDRFLLKNKPFCKNHISVIVKDRRKAEQIIIKLF